MNHRQFRIFVVRPTLITLGLHSDAAENLVIGTALHESGGLTYIDQLTSKDDRQMGPAFGLYQIEPTTYWDLWHRTLSSQKYKTLANKAASFRATEPDRLMQLATNLAYATAVCRLLYYRVPTALPEADDIMGLANYWKKWYNTPLGKGTATQWALHYNQAHKS